jgi:hypothetical protein
MKTTITQSRRFAIKKRLTTTFLMAFLLFGVNHMNAQSGSNLDSQSNISVQNDNSNHKVTINFSCDQPIENLLVIVCDSIGQTVFLDTQYRFKGQYNRSVDLTDSPKGHYLVKIIRDEEKINRKITMQ